MTTLDKVLPSGKEMFHVLDRLLVTPKCAIKRRLYPQNEGNLSSLYLKGSLAARENHEERRLTFLPE